MATQIQLFMEQDDEVSFLRFLERFVFEVYPRRVPADWVTFPAKEEHFARLPEEDVYFVASDIGPALVDRLKRGKDKGQWRIDEVSSPVVFWERCRRNEDGELVSGQLWAETDVTQQTGRRDAAPEQFRLDPYYLTTKAEELGYQPQVILAGRRINNDMGAWLAQRTVKLLVNQGLPVKGARVGVFGLTFKEDVADIRNSRVPDIVHELAEFGIEARICDPFADPEETRHEYGLTLTPLEEMRDLDALVLAVSHRQYVGQPLNFLVDRVRPGGVLVDVKNALDPSLLPAGRVCYWCL